VFNLELVCAVIWELKYTYSYMTDVTRFLSLDYQSVRAFLTVVPLFITPPSINTCPELSSHSTKPNPE